MYPYSDYAEVTDVSNQQRTSGKSGSQSGQGGIVWQQQFIVGFVGWLILQVLSPEEWRSVIGTFLTLEATSLFLLSALQRGGGFPTNGTIQFLLASYLGYFILYGGSSSNSSGGNSVQSNVFRKSRQRR